MTSPSAPAAITAAGATPEASPVLADPRQMEDPPGVENPYWQAIRQLPGADPFLTGDVWQPDTFRFDRDTMEIVKPGRDELVRRYSWAITDPASVAFVAEHAAGGLVEIGAGTGYWAWQLRQRGIPVIAYDAAPPHLDENGWCQERGPEGLELRPVFHEMLRGAARDAALKRHPLFLCWPPMSSMAAEALAAYPGDRVIYIGEDYEGCTADDDFHTALDADWKQIAEHIPVRWCGVWDRITVHARKV